MRESANPSDDLPDLPLGDAQPYRTPKAVSDETKKGGMKPLVAWVAVAGVLACGWVAYAYTRNSAAENVIEHVQAFGDDVRVGRPEPQWDGMGEP